MKCSVCGEPRDLRPYGAGGALICYKCMKSDPEREAEAGRQFNCQLGERGQAGAVMQGKILDFKRSGDLVTVQFLRDDGERVDFVTSPGQFRGMLEPEGRALFDCWWGAKPEAS